MVDKTATVQERMDRLRTQYRESPNLSGMIRVYLDQLADVMQRGEDMIDAFDIDSSTGDQLTIIGNWLGFPRTHCQGKRAKVFGFECGGSACDSAYPVGGFCEGVRFASGPNQFEEYTFEDDALYRRYIKARSMAVKAQRTGGYTREALVDAATMLFGDEAVIVREKPGVVTLCLTRAYTPDEIGLLGLSENVMPLPLGVKIEWAQTDGAVFGFGPGWGELCTSSFFSVVRNPLDRAPKSDAFGFGEGFSGLCEGRFFPLD